MRNIVNIFYNFLVVIYHCFQLRPLWEMHRYIYRCSYRWRYKCADTDTIPASSDTGLCVSMTVGYAGYGSNLQHLVQVHLTLMHSLFLGLPLELLQLPLWKRQQTIVDLLPAIRNVFNLDCPLIEVGDFGFGHKDTVSSLCLGSFVLPGAQLQTVGTVAKRFRPTI